MEDQILLHLREIHMYKDGDEINPIYYVGFDIQEGYKHVLPVINGIVYAKISCNAYEGVYAAIQETPAELSNNPYIKLVEINKEE